ncbi:MAG: TonB-dependent receptor [Rhodospirillaceae bacterium]|nr:TonB-dependent receptor [Rhodospirillaceae bacterium]
MGRSRYGLLLGATLAAAPASAQAASPQPADAAAQLDQIVVTARRRNEDVQSVPAALSVVSGDLLERSSSVNISQISQLVPSLNYSSANPRNTAFTVRGLGSSVVAVSQANDGLEPGVGFYVDQVYHARPATAAFDLSDLAQVEILRGPQGTLFGKNTTAGAINITSRPPSFTPEASAEVSYGDFNLMQAKVSASGALVADKLAVRISALGTGRDGVIMNLRNNRDHNRIGNQVYRGQALYKPGDAFALRIIGDVSRFKSNCCTQVYLRTGTSLRPVPRQYPALAAGLNYRPASLNPYDRVTDIDADLGVDTGEGGIGAIADWNLGAVTLTSVSAWRFWNWDAANDRDYTGIPIQMTQHIPSRQDQYSQEVRLASNGDNRLNYVLGLYAFDQKITGRPISIYGPQAAYWLIGPVTGATPVPANLLDGYGTDGRTVFATDSYAAFGEGNYKITGRLTATLGLRYTFEHKKGTYASSVFGGLATTNTALVAAKLSILRPQSYAAKDSNGSLSGRGNLAYRIAGDVMAYASYARGYKSGGINMSGLPLDAANQPVLSTAVIRPERNTTVEAGLKTDLLEKRLVLNVAAYRTRVKDFQATIVDSAQTVALRGYLSNIPDVTVNGFEGDATALLASGFTVRASVAYGHGEYTRYPAGPCPLEAQGAATAACDLSGRRLAGLPRWSETLGADYELPVTGTGSLLFHADSNWRGGYFGDPSLSRYTWIDGYNVTNANVAYRFSGGWEVAVFARNVFNANYIQNLTIQAGNAGLILGTPSDPRIAGVTLRAWW